MNYFADPLPNVLTGIIAVQIQVPIYGSPHL